ncbi:SpoIID/LytB domain-containing protein [Anoxybacter fermentans]|uniref:SpoIID/LytB domain-containing protein n=1 Tax=Anoxybacter fermentans TaxID=1323375 RepID=A0A3Q9HS71_9FIRM|nr:SpoIID/LytB domain-containing protein [Anoxybacter fermentans]AZR74575.1 SpoIID/LytB domain-containing protein [Anoxybacter fermentans]
MKKKNVVFLLIFVLLGVGIVGCNRTRVKGIKEPGTMKEEPEVIVILEETGEQKKMKLEDYIAGVVAGEMKPNWPENAYAAQAIIARTFALEYMDRKNTNRISSSFEEAQAFKPENVTDIIRRAVSKTRGEVALYNGKYIRAWFHSSAAGQTTTAKAGLAFKEEEPPYITSVKSPDDLAPPDIKNWTVSFDNASIADALAQITGVQANKISDIKITKKDHTGRATKIRIVYDGGSREVDAPKFRSALDPMKLKSTLIKEIFKEGENFVFKGSGFGHGVGMSQWGAHKMAKEGKSPEEIVKYYFKDIEIKKVYN